MASSSFLLHGELLLAASFLSAIEQAMVTAKSVPAREDWTLVSVDPTPVWTPRRPLPTPRRRRPERPCCSTMSLAFKRLEVWNPARRGCAASGSRSSPTTAPCGSLRRRFRGRSLRHSPPAAHLYIRKSSVLVMTGSNTR
ncbi:uncharacterized protein LOC123413250 [Hordeum vulgare subsp. vulgare]|uniref:uncharacterized protein LOC123413250 n=1 Tax=Hordeum vulgare subsp. vulgare TaxID=112509 RepID=UPI001D1A5818|nr:uncharacterized protein LOC123413250 [Hordeum vulgare subsp. vulgare]